MIAAMLGHALIATEKPPEFRRGQAGAQDRGQPRQRQSRSPGTSSASSTTAKATRRAPRWRPPSATISQGNPKLALASARNGACAGIPPGTPDYLRAQDIAMVSENRAEEGQEGRSERRVKGSAAGARRSRGGVIGAALTAGAAGPRRRRQLVGEPDRPRGADRPIPQSWSRPPMRCATGNMRRPSPPTARARNAVRLVVEGRRQARRHAGRILTIMPAAIAARAIPHIDRLLDEDKGLRVVYRELPILGPDSVAAARARRWPRRRPAGSASSMTRSTPPGGPGPDTIAIAAKAAGISPDAGRNDPDDRGRAQAQFPARRPTRRDRHAVVRRRRPGDQRRGRLRRAQESHRRRAGEGLS